MSQSSINRLDSIIYRMEDAMGVSSVAVHPDDAWGPLRCSTYEKSSKTSIRACPESCGYYLSSFESRCPLCYFSKPNLPLEFKDPVLPSFVAKKREKPLSEQQKQIPSGKKAAKKDKKKAAPAKPAEGGDDKAIVNAWAKVNARVGYVKSVGEHPEADGLYVCAVDVGDGRDRSVCAQLRKHFQKDELQDKQVCVVLNLKPRALRGIMSEAMILAGNSADQSKVSLLVPPAGSNVGDIIYLENQPEKAGEATLNPKVWKKVVDVFVVLGGKAVVGGIPLQIRGQPVVVLDLEDGSGIH